MKELKRSKIRKPGRVACAGLWAVGFAGPAERCVSRICYELIATVHRPPVAVPRSGDDQAAGHALSGFFRDGVRRKHRRNPCLAGYAERLICAVPWCCGAPHGAPMASRGPSKAGDGGSQQVATGVPVQGSAVSREHRDHAEVAPRRNGDREIKAPKTGRVACTGLWAAGGGFAGPAERCVSRICYELIATVHRPPVAAPSSGDDRSRRTYAVRLQASRVPTWEPRRCWNCRSS